MTTREAAIKWTLSVELVRRYCSDGVIPSAVQPLGKWRPWEIPNDAMKPPFGRHILCLFIDNIVQVKAAASIDLHSLGYNDEQISSAYSYLSKLGFITSIDFSKGYNEGLRMAEITPRGAALVFLENEALRKASSTTRFSVGASVGPLSLGIEHERAS